MGSGASRHLLPSCLRPSAGGEDGTDFEAEPLDETLGHSFCYLRSSTPAHSRSSSLSSIAETAFRSISGASVSANSSASLPVYDTAGGGPAPAPAPAPAARSRPPDFRSSASFSAIPLQLSSCSASGPLDRGFFLSGPIERGAMSGPIDAAAALPFSGPIVKKRRRGVPGGLRKASLLRRSMSERNHPWVVPLRSLPARRCDPDDDAPPAAGSVQWAHGKAGEDRVHVVVSEEHRWLFVGIYDGFNGPDAPEFLLGNLYRSVFNELRGLFWEEAEDEEVAEDAATEEEAVGKRVTFREDPKAERRRLWEFLEEGDEDVGLNFSGSGRFAFSLSKLRHGFGSWRKEGSRVRLRRWRYDSEEKARVSREVPRRCGCRRRKLGPVSDHELVLGALSRALEVTELAYLEMTDRAMGCNPELALMGSCLLVALMRDEDVYVMNVGDSRAIVAQYWPQGALDMRSNGGGGLVSEEESVEELGRGVTGNGEGVEIEMSGRGPMELGALQLSVDHSTSIREEILRIKEEHPDDNQCIVNDRVKGRLKVTRAFGAGFLKHPKWNNALLEIFRNEYIGTAPYISCSPSLCHHRLGPNDQFLVLSSDGLYQYLSNEEVVLHVESFMEKFADGDPAQSLIEELLSRAAKKAGMDFHELLDIPQGDRRKYHDDVTVMVVSLEGRIWKSSGKYL